MNNFGEYYSISRGARKQKLKIYIMTWNTQSKVLCGDRHKSDVDYTFLSMKYKEKCYQPDFFTAELQNILPQYDIFCLANQEDDSISEGHKFFDTEMAELGFIKVSNVEMLGFGETTITTKRSRGLRLSIYVKNDLTIYDVKSNTYACGGLFRANILSNKGGIASSIKIQGKRITFINLHLPIDGKSIDTQNQNYIRDRTKALKEQNKCFVDSITDFNNKVSSDYTFIMGDLNYRLSPYHVRQGHFTVEYDEILKLYENNRFDELYRRYDELHNIIKTNTSQEYNIFDGLKEGVNNSGIDFPPTCQMKERISKFDRCSFSYDEECYNWDFNRLPSFCDRILYVNNTYDEDAITCSKYKSFSKSEAINVSDHNMVYGRYEIKL